MKKISKSIVSSLAVLALLASCGKDSDKGSSGGSTAREAQEEENVPSDGSNIDGLYNAKFITLNPHVNGTIPGSATFYRKDDRFMAYVRLFAGGPKAWHQQFVYDGNRCPEPSDDLNGDGFIDIQEAEAVLGKILIPLDSDISTQSSGRRFFPLADLSGYYHYERATSFRRLLSDLQSTDSDPNDDTTKLGPGVGLQIVGRPVLILGITEEVQLPETVATKGRHKAFQNFPIACGIFNKVEELPGTPFNDEVPGPIAEVEDGQDRPAGDDIPDTTGGQTSGSTTGSTNDSDDGDGPVSDGEGRGPGTTTGGTSGGRTPQPEGGTTGGSSTGEERPRPEEPTPTPIPTEDNPPSTSSGSGPGGEETESTSSSRSSRGTTMYSF
jgi:hypothetical protein